MDDTPWTDAVDLIVLGQRTEAELRALLEWDQVGRRAADAVRAAVGTEDMFTVERGALAILSVLGETPTFAHMFRETVDVPVKLGEERDWYFQGMCAVFALLASLSNGNMMVAER